MILVHTMLSADHKCPTHIKKKKEVFFGNIAEPWTMTKWTFLSDYYIVEGNVQSRTSCDPFYKLSYTSMLFVGKHLTWKFIFFYVFTHNM